jgi:hypothetical protein
MVRFAAESLAQAGGITTFAGNFAANSLQMQQTNRSGLNWRLWAFPPIQAAPGRIGD